MKREGKLGCWELNAVWVLRTVNAVWLTELFVLPVANFFVLPFDSLFSDLELLIFIKSSPPSRSWTECLTHEALDLTPALHKQALIRIPVILALEKQAGRSEVQNHPCLGSDFWDQSEIFETASKKKQNTKTKQGPFIVLTLKKWGCYLKMWTIVLHYKHTFGFLWSEATYLEILWAITRSPILNVKTPNKTKLSTNLCFSINDVTKYCYEKLSNIFLCI